MAIDTLASIAAKCNCSVSTVSRVLSGKASKYRISASTEQRVLKEVERAHYTPSLIAKGLRAGKTDTIGLLIPGVDDTFFSTIASVIIKEARNLHYTVVVVDTQENEQYETDGFSALLARSVDGIIAFPCGKKSFIYDKAVENGIPVVIVDRYFEGDSSMPSVTTDNYRGAVMATDYLISMGHKMIQCIQGNPDAMTGKDRVKGYLDSMHAHGLENNVVVSGDEFSIQNGYIEANLALSRTDRPTAILALSNKILLGVVKAVHEAGLRIPDDISVLAFDDNVLFNYLSPKISCIAQPVQEIGVFAVKLLAKKMAGGQDDSHVFLPPALILRESVKRI